MNTHSKINILIADDHKMMLDGLRSLLANEANIHIVSEATTGVQVLDILAHEKIDVAVLDITMPQMDGYDTVLAIKQKYPGTKVIILSLHKDEKHVGKMLNAGVNGYIIKDRGSEDLVKAINDVAAGIDYYDSEVIRVGMNAFKNKNAGAEKEIRLTTREKDVLHLIADGFTSKEIGLKLYIAESTVETHRKNLLVKLALPNSKYLMKYAIEKGFGKSSLG